MLEKHLKAGDAGIQAALEEYSSGRLADVHALAYLDAISQHVRSALFNGHCATLRRPNMVWLVNDGAAVRETCRRHPVSQPQNDPALCKSASQTDGTLI